MATSNQKPSVLQLDLQAPAAIGTDCKTSNGSPTQKSPVVFKSWTQQASACTHQSATLRKMWLEPDWTAFKVRSKSYLQDKVKVTTESPLFELVWFELFSSSNHDDLFHICQSSKSFAHKAQAKYGNDMPQLFVVTLIIPGSPLVACVHYFARKKEPTPSVRVNSEGLALWERFLHGDDDFRKKRFKLIPRIPEGPWVVKKSVGAKPVILSHGLTTTYFQDAQYLEVVVDVASDRIAKHVSSLCRSQSTALKVDMGFVVEAQDESELPETLIGCVEYDHIDLNLALPMSARHAKRLAAKLQDQVNDATLEEESESEEELESKRPAHAGFAFLADSDSDSESDASEKEEEQEEEEEEEEAVKQPVVVVAAPPSSASKKKSKGKKKKGGQKHQDDVNDRSVDPEEQVDAILDALTAQTSDLGVEEVRSYRNYNENALFAVELKLINADKEMKRIFGVKGARESVGNRPRGDPRNAARKTTKKVSIVTPLDEWPRPPTFVGGGIRWTRANKPKGGSWNSLCQYFEITWSIAYKKAQEEFEILQRTHDPNLIGHFLQRYPFHIDALLQMSEVFQHHGQMDHASDCIKRCMYVLELAWADQFDVTKGNCRMDFHVEHNDAFYRALFLLTKQVGRRGCMRSAFETAKLLLGLDPQGDPMNILLAIDYYALTSRQCQFLVDLSDSKTEAVDRFKRSDESAKRKSAKKSAEGTTVAELPNLQFSLALAHFFLGNAEQAKELLAIALLKFPSVLKPLLQKISVNFSSASWQPIMMSRVFANAKSLEDDGLLDHLLDIYVTRNFSLWKVNEVQSFLLQGAQLAVNSPVLFSAHPQVLKLPEALHKYQRAVASDYSDEITTLPADHPMMQPPQLPNGQPMDEHALAQIAEIQDQIDAGNLPADANPLLLFLQTLLPWNRVQGAGAPGADGAAER